MRAVGVESPYLNYREAADYCRVHRTTLFRAVKDGRLEAAGPGSAVRFHRDRLDEWMMSRARK